MTYEYFESWAIHDNNTVGLPLDELNKFIEYWTNKPQRLRKWRLKRKKNFVMKLRLQTWKRNYERNQKQTTSYQRTQVLRKLDF